MSAIAILAGAAVPGDAAALASGANALSPLTGEMQANTQFANNGYPEVASDADGDYVVAWTTDATVKARRFGADGRPKANPFTVSTDASLADVGMDDIGNFVVGFNKGQFGSRRGYVQIYSSSGSKLGNEINVTNGTGDQVLTGVAEDDHANFVVVWHSPDADGEGVYARTYNAFGVQTGTVGGSTRVNTTTTGEQTGGQVAINGDGDAVVSYASYVAVDIDPFYEPGAFIARRLVRDSATPSGPEIYFARNLTYAFTEESEVDIGDNGTFAVAWTDINDVYTRAFKLDGSATNVTRANTTTIGEQNDPAVAINDAGTRWVATWEDYSGQDGSGRSVQARAFGTGGDSGNETQINARTFSDQHKPTIASDALNNFTFAYMDNNPEGEELGSSDDKPDIATRRFKLGGNAQFSPAKAQSPAIHYRRAPAVPSSGKLRLDLDCPLQQQSSCSVTIGGRGLSTRSFTVPSGRSKAVDFTLPASVRSALQRGSVKQPFTFTLKAGSLSRTLSRTLTLRAEQTRVKARSDGSVAVNLEFPAAQPRGPATLQLLRGKRVVASAAVKIVSGDSRTVSLKLASAERKLLGAGKSLSLVVRVATPFELDPALGPVPPGLPGDREVIRRSLVVSP